VRCRCQTDDTDRLQRRPRNYERTSPANPAIDQAVRQPARRGRGEHDSPAGEGLRVSRPERRREGAGGQPLPQLECGPVVAAVHGEHAFPHPGTSVESNPGVQEASTGAGESETPRGDAERVRGAQRWIVAGEGLVKVDPHRLRRGDLPVGRSARERFIPLHVIRTHERILPSITGSTRVFFPCIEDWGPARPRARSTDRSEHDPSPPLA